MATAMAKAFYTKAKVILVEPLGSEVRMGSVGYFDDGQWIEVGTTNTFFKLKLLEDSGSLQPNSFDGKGGKKLNFEAFAKGEASALTPNAAFAHARAEITFGSENAFVMNVKNQIVRRARELGELIAAIRYAYRNRKALPATHRWERKYAVVVGVASATSVTALSSTTRNATAVITGSATAQVPTAPASLDASMKVTASKESVDQLWRGPASGYAIQALRIKPSIFKSWDREDIVFVRAKDMGFAATAEARVARPKSYRTWAKSAKLKLSPRDSELLTGARSPKAKPGNRAAKKLRATVVPRN